LNVAALGPATSFGQGSRPSAPTVDLAPVAILPGNDGGEARQFVEFAQLPPGCAPVADIVMAQAVAGLTDTIIGADTHGQADRRSGDPLVGGP